MAKEHRPTKTKTYKLYHGSPDSNITKFDISKSGSNTDSNEHLLFFTDSKEFATDFSYEQLEGSSKFTHTRGKQGKVYNVDVTIKKPLNLTKPTKKDINNMIKMSGGELDAKIIDKFSKGNNQLLKVYIDVNNIKKYGYDGLIAKANNTGVLEYGVIDAKQVKIK